MTATAKPWQDVVEIGPATLYLGDCTAVMAALDDASAHACVTDPPYELGFMGKAWDKAGGVASDPATWAHVLRLLRPGGHCAAFAGSRTYHRIGTAIERAGFEIRDQLMWLYGSGFPKSLDVAKAIDKMDTRGPSRDRALKFTAWLRSTGITAKTINAATGTSMASHFLTDKQQPAVATRDLFEMLRPYLPPVPPEIERLVDQRTIESENMKRRAVVGKHSRSAPAAGWRASYGHGSIAPMGHITTAHTTDAKTWDGWGTALKPAHEPIALARKPFRGSVADNVLKHGTAAINIDATRVDWQNDADAAVAAAAAAAAARVTRDSPGRERWAGGGGAYLDPAASLATWQRKSSLGRWPANVITDGSFDVLEAFPAAARDAIRFFYVAKAGKEEREFGLADAPRDGARSGASRANIHPTGKPISLMAWLCRLVTPPGGTVLEPFMGSGSTGIAAVRHGFRFIGIEQSPEYFEIARRRIAAAVDEDARMPRLEADITAAVRSLQLDLLMDFATTTG